MGNGNKKSLRLLITKKCNLQCPYCCNNIEDIKESFQEIDRNDIQWDNYDSLCITGGEPLLNMNLLSKVMYLWWFNNKEKGRYNAPIYLYTNGLLLNRVHNLYAFEGITVGVHYKEQIRQVLEACPDLLKYKVRFSVQDIYREEYAPNMPDKFIKTWKMNDCYNSKDKEDWYVLR